MADKRVLEPLPITYRENREHRVVLVTASETLTGTDLLFYLETVTSDPGVQPGFNELFDLREVMEVRVSDSEIEDIAGFIQGIGQQVKETKTALVALDRNTAEVSYLYELLLTNVPATVRLFSDMVAARAWLGLPDARSAPRRHVSLAVLFREGIHEVSACVVNISVSGALLESGLTRPELGRMVKIGFSTFDVFGRVVRHTETGFAMEFLRVPDGLVEMLRGLS